ncbi:MAG: hypothetical protein AAF067_04600 [Pseudomonadota bacterium]
MQRVPAIYMLIVLAGCSGSNAGISQPATIQQPIPYEALVRQIKYDVGTYLQAQENAAPVAENSTLACRGQVEFAIEKVKLNVTASRSVESDPSAGLEVAVGPVGLEASGSRGVNSSYSIATTLVMYPDDEPFVKISQPDGWVKGAPLAETLAALKRDLIATSDTGPCFGFGDKPEGNTVTLGFGIDRVRSEGAKLKLFFFSVGATRKDTSSIANSIEITFRPSGEFLNAR